MSETVPSNDARKTHGNLPCDNMPEALLHRKPKEPGSDDCCGNGCSLCVFDIYEQELAIWKRECTKALSGSTCGNESEEHPLSKDVYRSFTIASISKVTEDCFKYRFTVPNRGSLGLSVGQHLILRGCYGGEVITRQYTPISRNSDSGYFDVLIKIYPGGKMSRYLTTLREGDTVEWRGPFGDFGYKPNQYRVLLLLAAGTGIAPMIQVLRAVVDNEEDETIVRLLFGVRKYEGIYLKEELNKLKLYWNVSIMYCLSEETTAPNSRYGEEIHFGQIDERLLKEELKKCRHPAHVLICGPNPFNSRFLKYLKEAEFPTTWFAF